MVGMINERETWLPVELLNSLMCDPLLKPFLLSSRLLHCCFAHICGCVSKLISAPFFSYNAGIPFVILNMQLLEHCTVIVWFSWFSLSHLQTCVHSICLIEYGFLTIKKELLIYFPSHLVFGTRRPAVSNLVQFWNATHSILITFE